MKVVADLITWLLDKDIRAKKAFSLSVGLIAVVIFHFAADGAQWFAGVERRGNLAVGLAYLLVLVVVHLAVLLIWTGIAAISDKTTASRKSHHAEDRRITQMYENLNSLTDSQRQLLLRYVETNTRQLQEHQIGLYRIVWESDVRVLMAKGMVRHHSSAGVYEIVPEYFDIVQGLNCEARQLSQS
jgi:hypothetical protein